MQTVTTIGLDIALSWSFRCGGQSGHPPSVEASPRPSVLPEIAAMPDRHRGLRLIAPTNSKIPYATSQLTRALPAGSTSVG